MPELVALAGGRYPFAGPGDASAVTTWPVLPEAAPEVAVVMPCGFSLAQTRREIPALGAIPEWRALPALRAGRASIVDGNAYFNRPGPRIVESAEILAGLVQPEACAALVPPGAVEAIVG